MRIGISILTKAGHNIWSNGIGQNVYHLACLLEGIAFVECVVLLDCGDQCEAPAYAGVVADRFPIIPLKGADDLIDVAIEVSGGLDGEWITRFRARGGNVIFHVCGQPYSGLIEPTTFGRPGFFSEAERCDEVWVLPKDAQYASLLRSIHRCPTHVVPYLWAPHFLDDTISMIAQDNLSFGYKPGMLTPGQVSPALLEPNISPIKMGIIPLLICEQVERNTPDILGTVHFMNGHHLADHQSFIPMVSNCNLYKSGKISLEGRDYFARVMGRGANMVVSHQITCPQNYLYLDALHGSYPLIHNSPLFADVGYYYADSNIDAAGAQIQLAVKEHDRNLESYAANASAKIRLLSPQNRKNRDEYARRLIAIKSKYGFRRAS